MQGLMKRVGNVAYASYVSRFVHGTDFEIYTSGDMKAILKAGLAVGAQVATEEGSGAVLREGVKFYYKDKRCYVMHPRDALLTLLHLLYLAVYKVRQGTSQTKVFYFLRLAIFNFVFLSLCFFASAGASPTF